jgi:hypothetical protein
MFRATDLLLCSHNLLPLARPLLAYFRPVVGAYSLINWTCSSKSSSSSINTKTGTEEQASTPDHASLSPRTAHLPHLPPQRRPLVVASEPSHVHDPNDNVLTPRA